MDERERPTTGRARSREPTTAAEVKERYQQTHRRLLAQRIPPPQPQSSPPALQEARERPKKPSKNAASKPGSGQHPTQSQFGKRRIINGHLYGPGLIERSLAKPIERNEGKPAHRPTRSGTVAAEITNKSLNGKSVGQIAKELGRQRSDVRRIVDRNPDAVRKTLAKALAERVAARASARPRRRPEGALRQVAVLKEKERQRVSGTSGATRG
jgi:hypothetical protein